MTAAVWTALGCAAILLLVGWLLVRRVKDVPVKHRMPKRLVAPTPVADAPTKAYTDGVEQVRFKPTPSTDTVYIPRVGAGQNKHFVDETAEMPAISLEAYRARHG